MKNFIFVILIFIFSLFFVLSCNNNSKIKENKVINKIRILPDSTIYSGENFSEYLLDSIAISVFNRSNSISDSVQKEIWQFYMRRGYQYAWFSERNLTNAAFNFNNQIHSYINDFMDSSLYNRELDSFFLEEQIDKKKFLADKKNVLKMELLLTSTFFNYAEKSYSGVVKNPRSLEWYIPRKKKDYQVLLDTLVSSSDLNNIQEPVNKNYFLLKEKLRQYRKIQNTGGWPEIKVKESEIVSSGDESDLQDLIKFLILNEDLNSRENMVFNRDTLIRAVKHFQHRYGLKETGKLDVITKKEMNHPVEFRIRQIMLNMERLRWLPVGLAENFILVNIPEYKIHVFDCGKLLWSSEVVVGKAATQTNIFTGNISQIVLNPYWVIPNSIIGKELLPLIKRNSEYLIKNNMEVLSGNKIVDPSTIKWKSYKYNVPYTIRQRPGKTNPLGVIKFLFPNSFSIYLHDTPAKSLFKETKRAFSHGCIRLAEAEKLALYILRNDTAWKKENFSAALVNCKEQFIKIVPEIPVYIVYFTTWVSPDGFINFRNDIYGLDESLAKEVFYEKK